MFIMHTSVSRPQLKSTQLEDRVMLKNSQVKTKEIEDHHRNFKFSKSKTCVTACNDSLNAKTSNVNFVSVTCSKCVLNDNSDLCVLHYINGVNSKTKKPIAVHISNKEPKRIMNHLLQHPIGKTLLQNPLSRNLEVHSRSYMSMLGIHVVGGTLSLPPGYKWEPKSKTWNVKPNVSLIEIIMFIIDSRCSKHMIGNLKLLVNFVEKFLGTMRFGNYQVAPILGYGDLVQGNVTIKRAWLWHRRLSHLNFDTINLLSKNDIVTGLPKLEFAKDHLCSSCELGKAKRKSFMTKMTPRSKGQLQLLHMDLCGPMRRSKDGTSEVLIDFLILIQRGLHAQVRTMRTDKGTKFLNKTLHEYFSQEDRRLSISEEALGAFIKSQTYRGQIQGQRVRQRKGHFQNQCSKLVASRDNEVNIAARDSDDALVCCVKNMVNDRIMDSGASFHATYCKEELERFKLRSGKVRSVDDKTLDIAGVGDVVLKTSFGTIWTMKDDRYTPRGLAQLLMEVAVQLCSTKDLTGSEKADPATMLPLSMTAAGRLDAKSMKCTFIGYGSDEMGYLFWDSKSHKVVRSRDVTFNKDSLYGAKAATDSCNLTKPNQKDQVVLEDSLDNLANKIIVTEHGLSLEITQNPGGSSDASEGSKNSRSFKDSGRSDEEDSKDIASSKEGGFETPQLRRSTKESRAPWKKAINEEIVSLEKNQTWSIVRLPAGKKALQSKWVFRSSQLKSLLKPGSKSQLQTWNLLNIFSTKVMPMMYVVFVLIVLLEVIESGSLIKTLPGFDGDLPFTLETGYVRVGELDDVQLFYYFFESEGNPEEDPLMLWLTGGSGCSGSFLYEIGPFTINYDNSKSVKAILEMNPHRWTK
ncbi:retrovirus-related pol polyprotein from transposon TNT 1-94, partial [Tanacetum coccineum]